MPRSMMDAASPEIQTSEVETMDSILQDIQYSARMLVKRPAFTLVGTTSESPEDAQCDIDLRLLSTRCESSEARNLRRTQAGLIPVRDNII